MNCSCSRKLSRSSSSVKLPKADKTIELIKDIISNVSPLKISNIIRETIEPQNEVVVSSFEEQGLESLSCKRRGRKPKSSKKPVEPEDKEGEKRKPKEIDESKNSNSKCESKRRIKLIKKENEVELLCIAREEFEKEATTKRVHDAMNKRKKYSTTSNETSFQCSPAKEPSISGYTVLVSDDEEDYEKEPAKKVKPCGPFVTDSKEQVSLDMQKEFGNTLSELGERLKNLTTLGNSMKTLSFLQQKPVQKDNHQQQQQHEPLDILNDFYSKVKKLYVEFGENLNQSK